MHEYELTIGTLLRRTLHRKSSTEIVYGKRRYTWPTFFERVQRLASGLETLGVKRGSKVAVIDLDTNRYMEAYYAVPMMGAILHTVNVRLPAEQIAYTIDHAEDDFLLVRDDFLSLASKAASRTKSIRGIVVMSDSGSATTSSLQEALHYEDLLSSASPHYVFPELEENAIATLFYTSGTTGWPKGVWFTHRQLVLHTLSVTIALSGPPMWLSSVDTVMSLVPFFHVHSWGSPYRAGLLGQKIVLPGKYDPATILELIDREGVTYSEMVPTILNMILNHPEANNHREALSRWKVTIGGAALPKELAVAARRYGIRVMCGYGLSETAPVLTMAVPFDELLELPEDQMLERVLLKAGLPIPLVDIRVVGEDMKDVPRDSKTVGEVVVRAPWTTREYYKAPELTAKLWENMWLHTGDLAVLDEKGYVKVVDRLRDVVKSGGEWISSTMLEDLLTRHPAVFEAAVISAKEEKWGERPVAIVSLKPGASENEQDLKNHLDKFVREGRIVKFWIPEKIIISGNPLPKASTGKIDKKTLRETYSGLLMQQETSTSSAYSKLLDGQT